jgi:hypothetical protein
MRAVDFSAATLARRWREIKPRLREDLTPWTRHRRKHLLEAGRGTIRRCANRRKAVYPLG